jgi:hypothetical protein
MDKSNILINLSGLIMSGVAYCFCDSIVPGSSAVVSNFAPGFMQHFSQKLVTADDVKKILKKEHPNDLNHDLEKAFKAAAIRSITFIRDLFLDKLKEEGATETLVQKYMTGNSRIGEIKQLLETQKTYLENFINSENIALETVDKPHEYLDWIVGYLVGSTTGVVDADAEKELEAFYKQKIKDCFELAFRIEVKNNTQAFRAYELMYLDKLRQTGEQTLELVKGIEAAQKILAEEQGKGFTAILAAHDNAINQIRASLDTSGNRIMYLLEQMLYRQPKLTVFEGYDDDVETVFKSAYMPFIGREKELALLDEFTDSEERFATCLITAPAGTGKSKLALHYCKLLRAKGYEASGFLVTSWLKESHLQHWEEWQPTRDYFIVIDYVSVYYKQVLEILEEHLQRRSGTFKHKVRVLLLERERKGEWWDKFEARINPHKKALTTWREPHEIVPLEVADVWRIFLTIFGKEHVQPPDARKTLMQFAKVDYRLRPLFAIIAALAMAKDPMFSLADKNIADLVKLYWDRERDEFWDKKIEKRNIDRNRFEQYKNLAALATLTEGLPQTTLAQLLEEKYSVLPDWDEDDEYLYQMLSGIGETDQGRVYLKIEPDICGEYFVHDRVLGKTNPKKEQEWDAIIAKVWALHPENLSSFMIRFLQDFPQWEHELKRLMPPPQAGATEKHIQIWSYTLFGYVTILGDQGHLEEAVQWFEILSTFNDASASELSLLEQAKAALNLVYDFGTAQQFGEAEKYYLVIKTLAEKYPGNNDIVLRKAKAAFNLVNDFGTAQQFGEAEKYYLVTKTLAEKYPGNNDIVLEQAKAAHNLGNYFGTAQQFGEAEKYYLVTKTLAEKYPGNNDIVLTQVQAAVNLVNDFGTAQQFGEAEKYYLVTKTLAEKYPGNNNIALEQAKAALNLVHDFGTAQQFCEAEKYYLVTKTLAEKYPGNKDIVLKQAQAAVNLVHDFGIAQQFGEAEKYYLVTKTLAEKYAGNNDIVLEQAKAAFNLVNYFGTTQQFGEAEKYYLVTKTLAEKYPGNNDLVLEQAKAAVNLVNYFGTAQQFGEAEKYYLVTKTLAEKYPGNNDLVLTQVQAAFNLVNYFGTTQQFGEAEKYYLVTQTLAEKYPGNNDIILTHAKAGSMLMKVLPIEKRELNIALFYSVLNLIAENYQNESWEESMPIFGNIIRAEAEKLDIDLEALINGNNGEGG